MDTTRLKELAGVQLNETPGYDQGYGEAGSGDSQVIGMVLGNLRVLKSALEQGDMGTAQEELQKAMSMLVRAKTGQ